MHENQYLIKFKKCPLIYPDTDKSLCYVNKMQATRHLLSVLLPVT